ncbi:polyhydroxyalkanoate depolymerase [Ancylobacter sp. TS-1]|uniref:polyhydroxyalkanoate depolymerase n=1 Tax=Ancylobacter sp. TS-1 TaxID=1850374 RepID=UPI001265CCD1|nr:polyhydroxyalkanoate depolymerase [Ancylobacter sp. TS-1]QFR34143.1 polyhydroxyalkanoate depolymerase [Ancylobacter sp. TS-1]
MAIGVFGDVPDAAEAVAAPAAAIDTASSLSKPLYWMFEMGHAALDPLRVMADAGRLFYRNPANPLSHTGFGKTMSASFEMFERTTRRYGKPDWGITETVVGATHVPVEIETVWQRPFCRLLHFKRDFPHAPRRPQPRMLVVAPLSGHYATLLRGTVQTLLPTHDIYVTDWEDARNVPMAEGRFDLDDYIDYLIEIFRHLGGGVHALAVCQPAVPVLAAVARMEAMDDPSVPASMVLMGGPIDTRESPTAVNIFAHGREIDWFRRNVITTVPWPNAGVMRQVYPGFLQLHGFMSMNLERHLRAHADMFGHLVKGDGDSAAKHREFYDEYLSVMDLPAEYYLQTLQTVFIDQSLPKGQMTHRGEKVDPSKIRNVALLTVEGENDDISGVGQTRAAHRLCSNLPDDKKAHYLQPTVGHYGVFNGSRFRAEIAPRIADFVLSHNWPRKGDNRPAE